MLSTLGTPVVRVRGGRVVETLDQLAVERPLQIRTRIGDVERVLSTTMRTPGDDLALAVGFLRAEGIIARPAEIRALDQIDDDVVCVELGASAAAALAA